MKAAHIVPDAFHHYTSVAGSENYPSPCHTPHTVCVCVCVCFKITRESVKVKGLINSVKYTLTWGGT